MIVQCVVFALLIV